LPFSTPFLQQEFKVEILLLFCLPVSGQVSGFYFLYIYCQEKSQAKVSGQ
jgi:hypothetical protein